MPYAKVFSSILASSVWAEPDATRIVWLTMLIMANRDGMVEATLPGIAYMARVSIGACEEAIKTLSSPDRHSRTKVADGCRVRPVEGGWLVINYEAYRDKDNAEEKAEAAKLRQQRKRQRDAALKSVTPCHAASQEERDESHDVTDVTPQSSSPLRSSPSVPDTSSTPRPDGLGESKKAAKEQRDAQIEAWFDEFWTAYDKRVGRPAAIKAFKRIKDLDLVMPSLLEAAATYRAATPDKQYRKHPATWLNQEGWCDEVVEPAKPPLPFAKPIPHIQNLALGTPSCNCPECVAYRAKRTKQA